MWAMPFLINQKRISVHQVLFLRAGYQAICTYDIHNPQMEQHEPEE